MGEAVNARQHQHLAEAFGRFFIKKFLKSLRRAQRSLFHRRLVIPLIVNDFEVLIRARRKFAGFRIKRHGNGIPGNVSAFFFNRFTFAFSIHIDDLLKIAVIAYTVLRKIGRFHRIHLVVRNTVPTSFNHPEIMNDAMRLAALVVLRPDAQFVIANRQFPERKLGIAALKVFKSQSFGLAAFETIL